MSKESGVEIADCCGGRRGSTYVLVDGEWRQIVEIACPQNGDNEHLTSFAGVTTCQYCGHALADAPTRQYHHGRDEGMDRQIARIRKIQAAKASRPAGPDAGGAASLIVQAPGGGEE